MKGRLKVAISSGPVDVYPQVVELTKPLLPCETREQVKDILKFLGRFLRIDRTALPRSDGLAFTNPTFAKLRATRYCNPRFLVNDILMITLHFIS